MSGHGSHKNSHQDIRSPLARARGHGAAGEGAGTWLNERISSVAALPLVAWLVWSVAHVAGRDHDVFTAWLAQPVNAVLMILSVATIFYHAALGCRVIVEDYVACEGLKMAKLIGLQLFFIAAAAACIFAILKIAFAA